LIIAQLLFLQMADPKKDIHFYINSPGGSVNSRFGHLRHDAVPDVRCEYLLHRTGSQHGRGPALRRYQRKRYVLPNANIMIHQVLGGAEGQASDVEIRVKYMLKLKQRLNQIISKHSGKPVDQVEKDCDRDNFMSADEPRTYGLVDDVVQSRKEIPQLTATDKERAAAAKEGAAPV
jgi:ATP-dependent Clp protease protease subunit